MRRRWIFLTAFSILVTCLPAIPARAASRSPWGPLITVPGTTAMTAFAYGVAIDLRGSPTGNKWAYTVDAATHRVIKFGTGGAIISSWPYGDPTQIYSQARIAVDGSGNVFVADGGTNCLYKFSPQGRLLQQWGRFGGLRDVALDARGNIYLAQWQAQRVTELSATGAVLRRWDTRTLWHGESVGYPTGVAVTPNGSVTIASTCLNGFSCARRINFLAGGVVGHWVDVLIPLAAQHAPGDEIGLVSIDRHAPRDTCNNRFVDLHSITSTRQGQLYVAGLLWPRTDPALSLDVGLGGGEPGCTHDGIGPGWTHWPLPDDGPVHGLAIDNSGNIYVAQANHILKLVRQTG